MPCRASDRSRELSGLAAGCCGVVETSAGTCCARDADGAGGLDGLLGLVVSVVSMERWDVWCWDVAVAVACVERVAEDVEDVAEGD